MKTLVFSGIAAFLSFSAPALAEEYVVRMISDAEKGTYRFEPGQLTVKSGDTVTWVNAQDDTHGVMSESVPDGAARFESPLLTKKDEKWSRTFTVSGTYAYHCHPHITAGMIGSVIVDHPSALEKVPDHDHDHATGK